jgi:uncharacterized membrane protein HdeD (DUF308 family)
MSMTALVQNWWMMAARGVFAMAFGAVLSLWQSATLPAVVMLFSIYAIVDGVWAIAAATWATERGRRLQCWPVGLEGFASLVIGVIALVWPVVPRQVISLIAIWGVVTGALELLTALAVPRERAMHWLLGTAGFMSLFLAALMMLVPLADTPSVVAVMAVYTIVFGALTISAAVRFRGEHTTRTHLAPTASSVRRP